MGLGGTDHNAWHVHKFANVTGLERSGGDERERIHSNHE